MPGEDKPARKEGVMPILVSAPQPVAAVDRLAGAPVLDGTAPATGVVYETFTSPFAD